MSGPNSLLDKAREAEGAITKHMVLVGGTAYPQVTAPAAANDTNIIGVALEDAADTETVTVRMAGIAEVVAGAAVADGDFVEIAGTSGKVITAAGAGTHYIVGTAMSSAAADGDIITVLLERSIGVL